MIASKVLQLSKVKIDKTIINAAKIRIPPLIIVLKLKYATKGEAAAPITEDAP